MRSLFRRVVVLAAVAVCGCAGAQEKAGGESALPPIGKYSFYLGEVHSHSIYSGDVARGAAKNLNHGLPTYTVHTPAQMFEKAKAAGYDFFTITDHTPPIPDPFYLNGFTDEHWRDLKAQAAKHTTGKFVALAGFEFSRNQDREKGGLGHMNVINTEGWKAAMTPGMTFEALYNWLTGQKDNPLIVAQFNHPPVGPGGKSFNNFAGRTKERNDIVLLAEIWNSSEALGHVEAVKKIWAKGWKVAPSAGGDIHGPGGIGKKTLRTGVLAKSLTKHEILSAMKARRVYATIESKLHLEFRLAGHEMGSALATRPAGELPVEVFLDDPTSSVRHRVDVCGAKYDANGGGTTVVATMKVPAGAHVAKATAANGYDFYYVTVYEQGKKTPVAFAAPVWMDNR